MTSLERYQRTLRGESVDVLARVPIIMQFGSRHIGSTYRAFATDHRVLVEANRRCAEDFGFDQVSAISDPFRETSAFGAEIAFPEDACPDCAHPPLEDGYDFARLIRPNPERSPRMADRVAGIRGLGAIPGEPRSVQGWIEGPAGEAADLRGVSNFLVDLIDEEPNLLTLMDRCVEVGLEFAVAQLRAGADTIGIGDAIASQISAGLYEAFIRPREQRLVDGIHAAGGRVRLHICGNINHLMPGIARLGPDLIDCDHQVNLEPARRVLGPRIAIAGNLDPVRAVLEGTPESIRRDVRRCAREAGWPYLVNAGCEIPPATPPENLAALCEPVRFETIFG